MGCNNSHFRPSFFRRCRRKKDDTNCTPKRQPNPNDLMLIDSNHVDANSSNDLLGHGFHFIGSSTVRNSPIAKLTTDTSEAPTCVPLLAQSLVYNYF